MVGWNANTVAEASATGVVTIIEGSSFCVSTDDGDIRPFLPQGVFVRDTRIISEWRTRINGLPIETLSVEIDQPHQATYVGRVRSRHEHSVEGTLIVERQRTVGTGLGEVLTFHNYSPRDVQATVEMRFESDFADIFDVKASRRRPPQRPRRWRRGDTLTFERDHGAEARGVAIHTGGGQVRGSRVLYRALIPARGTWSRTLHIVPTVLGREWVAELSDRQAHEVELDRQVVAWRAETPHTLTENEAISAAVQLGQSDIGSLRIFDPAHPDRTVIAAGAPWFMALFGRDSIISSMMTLPVDASIALGTLKSLGDRQGEVVDPVTEEQPGRILHEVRLGAAVNTALGGKDTYYGSIDATPLYVVAVGELSRWGLAGEDADDLLAHADRCLDWIDRYGDRDGDGFVEYERSTPDGLVNQGWKDSWDAINFADGSIAAPPIALCEVQGYVYAAYRARATLAREAGQADVALRWEGRAARLKDEFNARFWLPDRGYFAIALDRDKRPVDACASNMGQCLWSGIVDGEKAAIIAERLLAPDMFSGWGVRTLSTTMGAYNPASYHNGSVWPHDNALIAAGLMSYGFVEQAQRIALGLFDAAAHFDGRLPELFCGFSREEHAQPVPYPNACTPQAWAAATPFSLVRTLLQLDVDAHDKRINLAPHLPAELGKVRIDNLLVGGVRVDVEVAAGKARVTGAPAGYTIERARRRQERTRVD